MKEKYGVMLWVLVACTILVGIGTAFIIYRMYKTSKEKKAVAGPAPQPAVRTNGTPADKQGKGGAVPR
jgi:phosphate/sulfate permease